MKRFVLACLIGTAGAFAHAGIVDRTVDYSDGEAVLEGKLFFDNEVEGKQPTVVIFHQWGGPSPHEEDVARRLVEEGYAAFVADVYGKGVRPTTVDEKKAQATKYRSDRSLQRSRANAAVTAARAQAEVDTENVVAIGYCFGGGTALELARSGSDVDGVVSFHGNLDTPNAADAKNIKTSVLVLHGANDPYVPAEQVTAFEQEMREAGVDWRLISFGGAVHSFTDKGAGNDPSQGAAYNEKADNRSWEYLQDFLEEAVDL